VYTPAQSPISSPRALLAFLRASPGLRGLFEEAEGDEDVLLTPPNAVFDFNFSMHMLGATGYAVLVATSILLNEVRSPEVGWITGVAFIIFAFLGYLSGSYVPVAKALQGVVLLWNPFLREPDFVKKLHRVVWDYTAVQRRQRAEYTRLMTSPLNCAEDHHVVMPTSRNSGGENISGSQIAPTITVDHGTDDGMALHSGTARSLRLRRPCSSAREAIQSVRYAEANVSSGSARSSRSSSRRRSARHRSSSPPADDAVTFPSASLRGIPISAVTPSGAHVQVTRDGDNFTVTTTMLERLEVPTAEEQAQMEEKKLDKLQEDFFKKHYIVDIARKYPKQYLRALSHIYITVELIALMTPLVAMGIQWITALCGETAPVPALLSVVSILADCAVRGDFRCDRLQHSCIFRSDSVYMDNIIE
jgi:hypothetical protein